VLTTTLSKFEQVHLVTNYIYSVVAFDSIVICISINLTTILCISSLTVTCIKLRVVHGFILCNPIQPSPSTGWPNRTQLKFKNLDPTLMIVFFFSVSQKLEGQFYSRSISNLISVSITFMCGQFDFHFQFGLFEASQFHSCL